MQTALLYQKSLSSNSLFALVSINDSTQLVGGGQEFLRYEIYQQTTNDRIWKAPLIPTDFPKSILGILQISKDSLLAYGTSGFMALSANQGTDWMHLQLPSYKTICDATKLGNTIILTCNPYSDGAITTLDSKGNVLKNKAFGLGVKSIVMPTNKVGYATSSGAVFKTIDGGDTWNFTNAKNDIFTSCIAWNENDCMVCGFDGSIQRTIDGGETWIKIKKQNTFSTTYRWNKMITINTNTAFVIGDNGKMAIIHLLNNTYELLPSFTNANLLNVCIKSKEILAITTSDGNYCEIKL